MTAVEPQVLRRWVTAAEVRYAARYLVGVAALAGVYYGSAKLGYAVRFSGWNATILWLPAGFAIAFVYLRGLRYWPGVLIGDVWAHDYSHTALGVAAGLTCANLLEVLVGAALIRRLVSEGLPLKNTSTLVRLWWALAIATLVSAVIGSTALLLGGLVSRAAWPSLMRTWWLGDFVGALVVVPLVFAWSRPPKDSWLPRRGLELLLVLVVFAGLGELALRNRNPLTYLVFPSVIWCALRFGRRGATLAIGAAAGVVVWDTTHYRSASAFTSITRTVLNTQLFVAVCAVSALYLVALVSEREEFAERLGASRSELLHAFDSARRRIERDLHDGAQQRLVALAMQLRFASEYEPQTAEQTESLKGAEQEVRLAIDELRELARGARPSVLTNLGLARAVETIAASSHVPITLHELPTTALDERVELTAYFVIAEALTNALKYAEAREIHVHARATHRWLRIEVADDGVGGAEVRPSAGLSGLRDRVEQVGGRFDVVSSPGDGTQVTAALPVG